MTELKASLTWNNQKIAGSGTLSCDAHFPVKHSPHMVELSDDL